MRDRGSLLSQPGRLRVHPDSGRHVGRHAHIAGLYARPASEHRGTRFSVGIDVDQAQQTYSLESFQFNINGGAPEYTFTGLADIPAVNKGNGFSDARLVSFDITGLTGSGVFSATFANADAGREQFFLIPEGAGLLAAEGEPPAHAPEPGTLLLLATSMLGVGSAAWRRQRRSPMGG